MGGQLFHVDIGHRQARYFPPRESPGTEDMVGLSLASPMALLNSVELALETVEGSPGEERFFPLPLICGPGDQTQGLEHAGQAFF